MAQSRQDNEEDSQNGQAFSSFLVHTPNRNWAEGSPQSTAPKTPQKPHDRSNRRWNTSMARKNILRKVGKALVGLAAGGICLSPLQAQPPASRAETGGQAAERAGAPLTIDKEVTLAADGSFRAT